MNLQIVHVADLNGMYFNIPNYQRGYRWETKQVQDLLDDLLEFSQSKSAGAFYCLQPLVVVEQQSVKVESLNAKVFDVIDGQQRLTTLFLIINYLNVEGLNYHLRYERARSSQSRPDAYDNEEITFDTIINLSEVQIEKNPDFFYLSKALHDIESWFEEKKIKYPRIKGLITKVIVDDKYISTGTFYERESITDPNDAQKDVRFIWYNATDDTTDNTTEYTNSIAVFKRLNYGKTPLTSAELIKALLFQCDVYNSKQKAERKQVAFRMSTEWDKMEKVLQDKFMWSMLSPNVQNRNSHIDYVLFCVASKLHKDKNIETIAKPGDNDYEYIIFNKYIQRRIEEKDTNYACIVNELWERIQDTFDVLQSWFTDREIYHLIGLRLTLLNPKNKKKDTQYFQEYNKVINTLFEEYEKSTRSDFIKFLKGKIGDAIRIEHYNDKKERLTLADLEYGAHDDTIVKILFAYNVTLYLESTQDRQYFPFWYYQNITPSLEHIHPQHLHNEDIDFSIRCQWYHEKKNEIRYMLLESEKREKLQQIFADLDICFPEITDNNLSEEFKKQKANYEQNATEINGKLKVMDELFDELADISEKGLHSIRNLALVDKDTNTALGNGLMSFKRQKLLERQQAFDKSSGKEGAYTFKGTWKVFNKQFLPQPLGEEKDGTPVTDLLFWGKADRDNYFFDVERIYNLYK